MVPDGGRPLPAARSEVADASDMCEGAPPGAGREAPIEIRRPPRARATRNRGQGQVQASAAIPGQWRGRCCPGGEEERITPIAAKRAGDWRQSAEAGPRM